MKHPAGRLSIAGVLGLCLCAANARAEWVINTPGPTTRWTPIVTVYNDQQHFTYFDTNGNIQDVWYGSDGWHLQQLTQGPPSIQNEWIINTPGPGSWKGFDLSVSIYNGQQHFTYLGVAVDYSFQDVWYGSAGWHLQQLTQGPPSIQNEWVINTPGPVPSKSALSISIYNGQQHFTYTDNNNNIQDVWYGSDGWHLQQLTQGPPSIQNEWIINTPGLTTWWTPIVTVYNGQQHFTYIDTNGNIQDVWYGSGGWHLQQLTQGPPSVQNEWVINNAGPVPWQGDVLSVSVYNGQQHFTYIDSNNNIQDVWYGSGGWHLQQLTQGPPSIQNEWVINTPGPVPSEVTGAAFSISIYNGQQHFTYIDTNGNIQDVWFGSGGWHLQQLTQGPPSIQNEWVINNAGPVAWVGAVALSISIFNGQQHFTYIDTNGNIQDVWYGSGGWHLQQLTQGPPSIQNEWVINNAGPTPSLNNPGPMSLLSVSIYNGQQHFTYFDANLNIQDVWYGSGGWALQQLTQ
jgi:hypothetical protein